jgi:hypothetical protein
MKESGYWQEAYDLAPAEAHAAAAASALAEVCDNQSLGENQRAWRRVGTFLSALRENARRQVALPAHDDTLNPVIQTDYN